MPEPISPAAATPSQSVESPPPSRNPWAWISSLYIAEGLPNVVVMTVSVIMYKTLGLSNTEIALWTSWLYLPWVIKPLWSPVVDLLKTRRAWIWIMQLILGAGFAGVALTLPAPAFFQYSLAVLWLLAFSSATHDIAADGFYLLALPEKEQAAFVGIRSTFYRVAIIVAQGPLVILAGFVHRRTGDPAFAWSLVFGLLAALFVVFALYHCKILPRPTRDQPGNPGSLGTFTREFGGTFIAFFGKPRIGTMLAFLLLYRFAEAQLVKVGQLFMLDDRADGGLGLVTEEVGFIYGTLGVIALLCGGIVGGLAASRRGLKSWLWPMVLAINVPNVVYVYLAWAQPENLLIIGSCVAVEQFGYGFGFAAYMLYMMYIAQGKHQTAHYAICTGFMALGMMLPGMWSGWLQEWIGHQLFFVWVVIATIPGFIVTALIPLEESFGRRSNPE